MNLCGLFHSKRFCVDTAWLFFPPLRHALPAQLHPGFILFEFLHFSRPTLPSLTPGEEDGVELQAASILQPTGQLAEVTAVQEKGDPQGMSAAFHLVTHWCVCNKHTKIMETFKRGVEHHSTNENVHFQSE